MLFLPGEVQQYLRHILHFIGLSIATWGGYKGADVEVIVGFLINVISLGWFIYMKYKANRKHKAEIEEVATEYSEYFEGDDNVDRTS